MNSSDTAAQRPAATIQRDNSNILIIIASIIIAVIVTVALVIPPPVEKHELRASLSPGIASLAAGRTIQIELSVWLDDKSVHPGYSDIEWHVNPYWLGDLEQPSAFELMQKGEPNGKVNFTAGEYVLAGNVSCIVTYRDFIAIGVANITVGPPALESAKITPADTQVLVNRNATFSLVVHDSLGETDLNFSADWSVEGLNSSDYEMNSSTGRSVKLLPKALANVTLRALVQKGGYALSCNASVEVVSVPPKSVDYRWYDMFNVPFGEWYDQQWKTYRNNEIATNSYPYIFRHYTSWPSCVNYYSNMRLNITASSLTEISMNERPEFLPFLGPERGGNAIINWYMQYLTSSEIHIRYPTLVSMNDGWFVVLNGTVTLDKQAAFAVLGLTEVEFVDFSGWWHSASPFVMENYTNWLVEEAGSSRLDIWPMYGWHFALFHFVLDAEKVDNQVVLRYDVVSWGMEALMTRWLHEAFLPTEWWFEDMKLNARIGPSLTDIDLDAVVKYAVKASNSTQTNQPCWMWEAMLQHMVPYNGYPNQRIQSPYFSVNWRYMDMGRWVLPPDPMPGGLPITYTPGSFNLTAGEELRFEWPSADVHFMTYPFLRNWTNTSAKIELGYSEPNQTEMPGGQYVLNLTARYLEFIGPFDFWTWSKDQTGHAYLADKWGLFGLLPYGMPYLEFWPLT